MSEDTRNYVDRIFFDCIDGKRALRETVTVDCAAGVPSLPDDRILILENYKKDKRRGRKDKLEGEMVLMLPTDKQPLMIPLGQGLQMANQLHSYVTSLLQSYTPPVEPEIQEEQE